MAASSTFEDFAKNNPNLNINSDDSKFNDDLTDSITSIIYNSNYVGMSHNITNIIIFDIEFHRVYLDKSQYQGYKYKSSKNIGGTMYSCIDFVRELGYMVLSKQGNEWCVTHTSSVDIDHVGLFNKIQYHMANSNDNKIPGSTYMTVSQELNIKNYSNFILGYGMFVKTYQQDPVVAPRILNDTNMLKLLDYFNNNNHIVFVHKGQSDINALFNTYKILGGYNRSSGSELFSINNSYDIKFYDGLFVKLTDSSALDGSLDTLLKSQHYITHVPLLSKLRIKKFYEKYTQNKPHNPLYDSACTLLICIIMNYILLSAIRGKYVVQQQKEGESDNYYYKYMKYKNKYISMK